MEETPSHIDLELFRTQEIIRTESETQEIGWANTETQEVVSGEEIPELTEVVAPAEPPETGSGSAFPTLETDLASEQAERLNTALSKAVQTRLRAEIPTLVEAALHAAFPALAREIQQGLEEVTRDAIKDFLTKHGVN